MGSTMRVAIISHDGIGYIQPMTGSLERMLDALGVGHRVFRYGLRLLHRKGGRFGVRELVKGPLRIPFVQALRGYDAIIVVQHQREAYYESLDVEWLREQVPRVPILLYDLVYLPTIGLWGPWIDQRKPDYTGERVKGMERYDWYLCASKISRCAMPEGPQPVTQIGIDLNDGTLFPEQGTEYRALVDFARDQYPDERALVMDALRETGIAHIELTGRYTLEEIHAIYRTCHIYFIAHMESFGLPICELQACGCYIFTPYAHWCDSHRLEAGNDPAGPFTSNFVVYGNRREKLTEAMTRLRDEGNPAEVVATLMQQQPHFYRGDPEALRDVLKKIEQGEIDADSHRSYESINDQIAVRPEF